MSQSNQHYGTTMPNGDIVLIPNLLHIGGEYKESYKSAMSVLLSPNPSDESREKAMQELRSIPLSYWSRSEQRAYTVEELLDINGEMHKGYWGAYKESEVLIRAMRIYQRLMRYHTLATEIQMGDVSTHHLRGDDTTKSVINQMRAAREKSDKVYPAFYSVYTLLISVFAEELENSILECYDLWAAEYKKAAEYMQHLNIPSIDKTLYKDLVLVGILTEHLPIEWTGYKYDKIREDVITVHDHYLKYAEKKGRAVSQQLSIDSPTAAAANG